MNGVEVKTCTVTPLVVHAVVRVAIYTSADPKKYNLTIDVHPDFGMRIDIKHWGKKEWTNVFAGPQDQGMDKVVSLLPRGWTWQSFFTALVFYEEGFKQGCSQGRQEGYREGRLAQADNPDWTLP